MNVATMQRRVQKLERLRGIGQPVSVLMEQGANFGYLSTGGTITMEEIDHLAARGVQVVIREYGMHYLGDV
jgi:hypothetical protein